MATYCKLHTKDAHTLGATVNNLDAPDLCILDIYSCVFRARILLAFYILYARGLVQHINVGTAITYWNLLSPPPYQFSFVDLTFFKLRPFVILTASTVLFSSLRQSYLQV